MTTCKTCKFFDDGRNHCWNRNGEDDAKTTSDTPACNSYVEGVIVVKIYTTKTTCVKSIETTIEL